MRLYVSMVADLFHYGHVRLLERMSRLGDVVVGIHSDEDVAEQKRLPIMDMAERLEVVRACKYVNEVIGAVPFLLTSRFLEDNKIDWVVAGDNMPEKYWVQFEAAVICGKFLLLPRTKDISTTEIIRRVKETDRP